MTIITVPATSANLGPGFDSIGLAIKRYLTIEILAETEEWLIEHDLGAEIPHDETNLVIQTAVQLVEGLAPHRLIMKSEIPPARGLGSSSAAIVAGIELADVLGDLRLSIDQKIQIGSKIEGHPDNVLPAVVGNCTVGTMMEDTVYWKTIPFPEAALIVTVPKRALLTTESREALPHQLDLATAVKGSSVSNVLLSALHSADMELAGKMMEEDVFHEPYRATLIPELALVRKISREMGAYGTYLSGAGTTVMTVVAVEAAPKLLQQLQGKMVQCDVFLTSVDQEGVRVAK